MSEMDDQGVRNAVAFVPATSIQMRFSDAEAAKFDRWLTADRAEVWNEGHADGAHNEHEGRPGRKIGNPYRTPKVTGGPE